MKEKKNLELYNYLIKELSLIQLYKIEIDEDKKNSLIEELEKELMDELNYFENVNFSRINYFYKDYHPSPLNRIVLLLKDKSGNYYLKKDEKEGSYLLLNGLLNIDQKIDIKIEELLKENDITSKKTDISLKLMKYRKPFENENFYYPLPEYLMIFEVIIDELNNDSYQRFSEEELEKVNLTKEINSLDLKDIIETLKNKKDLIID